MVKRLRPKPGCCPLCAQSLPSDGLAYNRERATVMRDGSAVNLTPLHNRIFNALWRSRPTPIPREALEISGWDEVLDIESRKLAVQLCAMRKFLLLLGVDIVYAPGDGYYLLVGEMPAHAEPIVSRSYRESTPEARARDNERKRRRNELQRVRRELLRQQRLRMIDAFLPETDRVIA